MLIPCCFRPPPFRLDPTRTAPSARAAQTDRDVVVELDGDGRVVTVTAEKEPGSAELQHVKLRNPEIAAHETQGRGGVDDLINLTHLHEPSILHVLVRPQAILSARPGPTLRT